MSAYIHFFVRAGDTFCPIATYDRGSKVYEIFHRAPYEQIEVLDEDILSDYFNEATIIRDNLKEDRIKYEKRIETIKGFENSAEEKLELICECEELIEETDSELREVEDTICFIGFLTSILSEILYDVPLGIFKGQYLYYGIECYRPTVNDIKR